MPGALAPATPLPQSTTIFIGRASFTSPTMRSRYAGSTSTVRTLPPARRCQASPSIMRRSA